MGLEIQAQINASKLCSNSPIEYNQLTDSILADGRVLWGWRYTRRSMPRPSFSPMHQLNTINLLTPRYTEPATIWKKPFQEGVYVFIRTLKMKAMKDCHVMKI